MPFSQFPHFSISSHISLLYLAAELLDYVVKLVVSYSFPSFSLEYDIPQSFYLYAFAKTVFFKVN